MDLGDVRAFLPSRVPPNELPSAFAPYLAACAEVAGRYPEGQGGVRGWLEGEFARYEPAVRQAIRGLSEPERDKMLTLLSVLGHTYRWNSVPPAPARFQEQRISLPPGIAEPWSALARSSGQPRVGTMWSFHLCNWAMNDRPGGVAYRTEDLTDDNVRVAQNWLLPPFDRHLERFSVSFVLLEARGASVLRHLVDGVEAFAGGRLDEALATLEQLQVAIKGMTIAFSRNIRSRTVDPSIWLELVQPTFAWSAEAGRPGRIEGGPSGMQLGTIQALDAFLGVGGHSALDRLARSARRYMPRPHRRFLRNLDLTGPLIRAFIRESRSHDLREQFNECVCNLNSFRATHKARGAQYLRNRPGPDAVRASTGLVIAVDDDPIATFERAMAERITETSAAILSPARGVHDDHMLASEPVAIMPPR